MSSPNCSSVENVSWPFAPRTTSWHGGKRRRRRRLFRACLSGSQRSFSAKLTRISGHTQQVHSLLARWDWEGGGGVIQVVPTRSTSGWVSNVAATRMEATSEAKAWIKRGAFVRIECMSCTNCSLTSSDVSTRIAWILTCINWRKLIDFLADWFVADHHRHHLWQWCWDWQVCWSWYKLQQIWRNSSLMMKNEFDVANGGVRVYFH